MAFDERGWIPKLHLYSSDEAATVAVHDPPVVTMKRCTLRRSESLPISFTEKKRHFKTTDCQNKTRRLFSNNSWTTKVESSVDKPQDRKRTCSPLAYKRRYSKREDSQRWVYPRRDDYDRYLIPRISREERREENIKARDEDDDSGHVLLGLAFVDEATN
jgi:hypothetical protein